jgi:hypothetical protein
MVLALSWFFVSGLSEVMFMDYSAPDLGGRDHAQARAEILPIYLQQIMVWENLLISSMMYIIHVLPLFYILPTMTFSSELKSYFVLGAHRFKSYKKSLVAAILKHSFIAALVCSLTFILFFAINGLFVTTQHDWMTTVGSFLPDGFYEDHTLLFFAFLFGTVYFLFGFLFALISCGIMLYIERPYFIIIGITVAYYLYLFVGGYFDYFLSMIFGYQVEIFWIGSTVTAFNTFRSISQVLIPLIPVGVITGVIIYFGIKRYAKKA